MRISLSLQKPLKGNEPIPESVIVYPLNLDLLLDYINDLQNARICLQSLAQGKYLSSKELVETTEIYKTLEDSIAYFEANHARELCLAIRKGVLGE